MKIKDINRAARDRRLGIMFGLAYGDAIGRPLEFIKSATLAKFDPFSPRVGVNRPEQGIVTDDTQMSIAVARAALGPAAPEPMTTLLIDALISWYNDPKSHDGKRAPGLTCLNSARALRANPFGDWRLATDTGSKGNGANMRVAPLALRTDWTWDQLGGVAQLQAALTHGHPTAVAAAHLTAAAVRMLLEGIAKPGEQLIEHLLSYAHDQRSNYYGDWLGDLWKMPTARWVQQFIPVKKQWWEDAADPWGVASVKPHQQVGRKPAVSPQQWIERGWDKMIDSLGKIYGLPRLKSQDPCVVAGGGWVAEEALTASLHTLLCFPDEPTDALRRAAFTDGDSDSIASITGALAGAAYGRSAFPAHWVGNIEYRHELDALTNSLTRAARGCR